MCPDGIDDSEGLSYIAIFAWKRPAFTPGWFLFGPHGGYDGFERGIAMRIFITIVAASVVSALISSPLFGQTATKKYAFLVGVLRYDHPKLKTLRYCENDVLDLSQVLRGQGYQITLMCDREGKRTEVLKPTNSNILSRFREMLKMVKPGDSVLVILAGHGIQFENDVDAYFCGSDSKPFRTQVSTMVSLSRIYRELDESHASVKVLLVDACRNDPELGRGINADSAPRPPRGVAALFSCAAGERSFEIDDYKHGIFFHHVLEGLRGKAQNNRKEVTFNSLADHCTFVVPHDVAKRIGDGAQQSPNQKGDLVGPSPVLVRLSEDRNVEPELAPLDSSKKTWKNSLQMELVFVPAGRFFMGSPPTEDHRVADDEELRPMEIKRGYWMGKFEVTVGQFREFVRSERFQTEAEKDGEGGWGLDVSTNKLTQGRKTGFDWRNVGWKQADADPVVNITWRDAKEFCRWLSTKENKSYALPTEVEWEYACRAGTKTAYSWGETEAEGSEASNLGPWTGHRKDFTKAVGQYPANAFGLHDMHGNVAEWCEDAADSGLKRVLRGGSWFDEPKYARAAARNINPPAARRFDIGFRIILRTP